MFCPVCNGDHAPDQYQAGYFIEGTVDVPQVVKVEGEQAVIDYARETQRIIYWDLNNLLFGLAQAYVIGNDQKTGQPVPTRKEQDKLDAIVAAMRTQ